MRRNGTLYMIAPGTETAPIAPLFQAFVQHVHYEAGLIGSKSAAGKLDPPLCLALDELTQVCPLPLPAILADSAGKGILVAAVVHSIGQLETRWGRPGAETVWATCGTKILLSGITDAATLEQVSRLCGVVGVPGEDRAPAMPPELLRLLPRWRALVLTLNNRPLVVKTRPVWHRLDHRFGQAVPPPLRPWLPSPGTGAMATAPDSESLAAQLADLRGKVVYLQSRFERAALGSVDLPARVTELAQAVAELSQDETAPRRTRASLAGPARRRPR